ncbi:MAG: fumarate hydratase [Candidatus Hydrogenedentes bacterium CG07_land_8_20_14_0_80_42_17]|nr:MAG: fumarate hydratase [Candidatus Hydrogenedentes bacterium CG07_land_8_20_14_0_80_42_17]
MAHDLFVLGEDKTNYRLLTDKHVSVSSFEGQEILKIEDEGIRKLTEEAMRDVSFFLRAKHLEQVSKILTDSEASSNDKGVALALLQNAVVASEGVLPLCQDTGTAQVIAKKGHLVFTSGKDKAFISEGIRKVYLTENLRYSQNAPLTMFKEKNTGNNMPAQIEIQFSEGMKYEFFFIAKGGGSANKTYLYQETAALLSKERLKEYLIAKMKTLGTAACPPYHIGIVVGGTSADLTLKTVKLATTGYLDELPTHGNEEGQAFRDIEMEDELLKAAYATGIGAQFGGKYFALDVRVIRLPRHGASLPIGLAVSCSAHRNMKAKIDRKGIWVEELEKNPARFIPEIFRGKKEMGGVKIDLRRPMNEIRTELSKYPVKTMLSLTGTIIVARDLAHSRLRERLERGEELPDYFKNHPVYYAGPAKIPEGMAAGSFGPTTAGRMDVYVDLFQSHGGSLIMIAKGNRSKSVTDACKKWGGFYLGSIGGPAAILAKDHIKKMELIEYPELGMEAIYRIEVEDFPAFILVDDKGNDFYASLA